MKVLFDTNVLVASSIFMVSEEISFTLKHPFYDQSVRLLSFMKKNLGKRIGIVTSTIEEEADRVFEQAIRSELARKKTLPTVDFELFSIIHNTCGERKKEILSYLAREPTDSLEVSKNFNRVNEMYKNLTARARTLPRPAVPMAGKAPKRFKGLAFGIYKTQDEIINSQLTNLLRQTADITDRTILAEAIYLLNIYKQTLDKNVAFYIASTDHHFSPVRKKSFESRGVTDAIHELFGIVCDWPRLVEHMIKQDMK